MRYLLLICCLIPFGAHCQFERSIDLVAGIGKSFRFLSTMSDEPHLLNIIEFREEREQASINWQLGFNYNHRLNQHVIFKVGIRLASLGHKDESRNELRWGTDHDGSGGVVPSPEIVDVELRVAYWFVEVPIVGRWEIGNKKLIPFVEFGALPSIFTTFRSTSIIDGESNTDYGKRENGNFNLLHLAGFASVGLNYQFQEKMQFFVQPNVRYHFTNISGSPIKDKLYSYGLELGLRKEI
ncbi:MAG: hypothetical protein AAF242_08120 [Bacteroidota bacterium]